MKPGDMRVMRPLVSLKRQVIDKLRGAITGGRFLPGDRLVERELCEMLDVSRTLLREALGHLEVEGLVQVIPHRGPMVAVYTAEQAKSIYEARAALEEAIGRLFAERATDVDRAALVAAFDDLKQSLGDQSGLDSLAAKSTFYAVLAEGAHNLVLAEMLRMLHGRITMLRATTLSQPGRPQKSIAELTDVVRAIKRRDGAAAAKACRRHVENAAALALAVLSQERATLPVAKARRGARIRNTAKVGAALSPIVRS